MSNFSIRIPHILAWSRNQTSAVRNGWMKNYGITRHVIEEGGFKPTRSNQSNNQIDWLATEMCTKCMSKSFLCVGSIAGLDTEYSYANRFTALVEALVFGITKTVATNGSMSFRRKRSFVWCMEFESAYNEGISDLKGQVSRLLPWLKRRTGKRISV